MPVIEVTHGDGLGGSSYNYGHSLVDDECVLDRLSLVMGYAGVYSSFLKHAYRAAERYGVSGADILMECGNRKLVGGQEDQIIQIAADLAGGN